MHLLLLLLLRILGIAVLPRSSSASSLSATSEIVCHRHERRSGGEADGTVTDDADTVFSGTILELFPNHATSRGGHPGVVRVRSVYKGDMGIERFPVVVEGFGSSKFCWKPARKVRIKGEKVELLTFGRKDKLALYFRTLQSIEITEHIGYKAGRGTSKKWLYKPYKR